MSEIDEYRARLTAALDRVEAGAGALRARAGSAAAAEAQLAEERTVAAQLEERVARLRQRQAEDLAAAEHQMQEMRDRVTALDADLQKLREVNDRLRHANAALRDANAAGLADPALINEGLAAELDALRADRAAEMGEVSAILAALAPVLRDGPAEEKGVQNA